MNKDTSIVEGATINNYKIHSILSETNHSIICIAEGDNSHKKILKFIKSQENLNIDILRTCQHENIVKLENEFPYNKFYCFVFPFITQLSLHHIILTRYPDGLPEQLASKIFYQMLNAVNYLHGMYVCHNDINLNKVLVSDTDHVRIFLSLSQFSSIIPPDQHKDIYCGTPEYVAPEIITHTPFDNRVDIWSLGVSLFVMLSGRYPFPSSKLGNQYAKKITEGDLNYSILVAKNVSNDAINLVESMCKVNPDDRITIQDALVHPWIMAYHEEDEGNQINTEVPNDEDFQ